MKIILLAAGRGKRFGRRTQTTPKCLIPIGPGGQNLLRRYFLSFRRLGLQDVVIVVGHQKEKIIRECARIDHGLKVRFIPNEKYTRGSLFSLFKASEELRGDCLIMDADVYFPIAALRRLVRSRHSSCFLIDPRSKFSGEEMMVMSRNGKPSLIAKKVDPSLKALGESVGFLKISKTAAEKLKKILKKFVEQGKLDVEYEESYNVLMKKTRIGCEKITEFWTEMDFEEDLRVIQRRHRR